MSDNKFKTMRLIMDTVDFRARQRLPKPTLAEVRAALAELGVNGAERVAKPEPRMIDDFDELMALPEATVVRDVECRVLEKFGHGWSMTGVDEDEQIKIDLPARVLYTPQDPT